MNGGYQNPKKVNSNKTFDENTKEQPSLKNHRGKN